nr:MAG TPA: hypothetical protein [Caudoviricetes sp.]
MLICSVYLQLWLNFNTNFTKTAVFCKVRCKYKQT